MHRFVPEADSTPEPLDPAHTQALKTWARAYLKLPEETTILVATRRCLDAGCPIAESSLTVFDEAGTTRTWRLSHPSFTVSKVTLFQVLATPPEISGGKP